MNSYMATIHNPQTLPYECYRLFKAATNADEHLYMLIDSAHDERIYPMLAASKNMRCCLFSEENTSPEIKAVAPYLIKIKTLDESLQWCLREGLHQHWMLFFVSTQEHVSELRQHFKRFAVVEMPNGKQGLFRYYDPRVLPAFLKATPEPEREKFFHSIRLFLMPQKNVLNGSVSILQWEINGQANLLDPLSNNIPLPPPDWLGTCLLPEGATEGRRKLPTESTL